MASGGFQPNKQGRPEPKRRSNWQRSVSSDRDDAQSLNSLPSDIRINNWDLSDLRPTNLGGDSKRRKKSKGNPEREREQSLSVESPPHDQKQHSPSSYPRTKLAGSATSQRVALENLKQHLSFSDMDDQVSTDGERNNERQASQSHRRRLQNASFNHTESESDRRINRNNNVDYSNRDQDPDSNEVMARLMQIRDFMKQARSMLDSMERLGDRKKSEDIEKVRRLIRNLQEQEQGYRGLLHNTLQAQRDDDDRGGARANVRPAIKIEKEESDDDTSVDLEVRTENSETSDNSQGSRPRIESKLGIECDDDGDQSQRRPSSLLDTLRGRGFASPSTLANANTSENATMTRSPEIDNLHMVGRLKPPVQESDDGSAGVAGAEGEPPSLQHQELLRILKEKQQQLQDLMGRQEELNMKRRETEKKLLQAQARDNKAQAALSAVSHGRQFVEQQLASHQTKSLLEAVTATSSAQAAAAAAAASMASHGVWDRPGAQRRKDNDQHDDDDEDDDDVDETGERGAVGDSRPLKSNIVGYPESDDEDNSNVRELGTAIPDIPLPNELQEIQRQLNFLRNEFTQVSDTQKNVDSSMLPSLDEGRQQLQNKLQELQDKRSGLDELLNELRRIHSQPLENLRNNDSVSHETVESTQNVGPGPSNIPSTRPQQKRQLLPMLPLPPPPPPPPQRPPKPPVQLTANLPTSGLPENMGLPANLQASMNDMAAPTSNAVDSALATFAQLAAQGADEQEGSASMDPAMVAQVQEKLRRLKEVRGQLDQLRGLVEYYQNQRDELEPGPEDFQDGASPFSGQEEQLTAGEKRTEQSKPAPKRSSAGRGNRSDDLVPSQSEQQKRSVEEAGAVGGASSLHSMVQLLNLAGTDQGDEHSDEDNASVSQSDSQWSHLGPWDNDPEIQEKVKKLKAAKEKLRQLQDLVAFVQQSPDAARALPDNMAEQANSTEDGDGEAVSQATQTDEPNASVSEGDALSDAQQRMDNTDGMDGTRTELERLRKERAMLLEIQTQLKQIQDQTEGVNENSEDRSEERRERRDESNSGIGKGNQAPSAPVVTFASNDELYSKMRRQRILREELRSKKKELEAIMKKDRNKRQYSRNQDNQSDTVSLNTDTFGIPASVDATMATWGGSTVDNLENITEDEDGQERNEDEDDDGYPSDGIVQVEEEEEENDSDNGTYTIEADARQRKNMRKGPMGASGGMGARPKTARGRQTYPQPAYSEKNIKKSQRQKASKSRRNQRDYKPRQENYRSAEDLIEEDETSKTEGGDWFQQMQDRVSSSNNEWFQQIQDRLSTLTSNVEVLMRRSDLDSRQLSVSLSQENAPPAGSSMISPMQEQMFQLQNQSMMLSFGQVVQSLARQQGDMNQLQQQIQTLQLQLQEVHEQSFHGGLGASTSQLFRPGLTQTPLNNSSFNLHASTAQSMSFNHPQMPSPFTQSSLNNTAPAGFLSGLSPGIRSIHQQSSGLGMSTGNLSTSGADGTRVAGGLSANAGASSTNPSNHLSSVSGFVFNPLSHSTLGSNHQNNNSNNQAAPFSMFSGSGGAAGASTAPVPPHSSVSTMTRDFSQFINFPLSAPSPGSDSTSPGQLNFGSLFGGQSTNQNTQRQHQFPTSSSFLSTGGFPPDDEENPMPWSGSLLSGSKHNKKRKYGSTSRIKKFQSDPSSGPRMSTARSETVDDDESSQAGARPLWSMSQGQAYRSNADRDDHRRNASGDVPFDANSSFSSIQSIRDQHSKMRAERTNVKSTETGEETNTLFDTLRDTIYTEVASLISQNESRPHFLLELFRDVRQVDSDFMRQRTLYAMQDLLRSRIKEGNSNLPAASWLKSAAANTAETANSEQTPSESMTSEDDEDLKVTRLQEEITAAERSRLNSLIRGEGSLRGYPFDYVESADNPSSLSTPTNGAEDAPFFQDALGETVIGFESLKLQETERVSASKGKSKKQGAAWNTEDGRKQKKRWGEGSFLASEQLLRDMHPLNASDLSRAQAESELARSIRCRPSLLRGAVGGSVTRQESQLSEMASSSAVDQASESSMSDMAYPRIDMKQLDRQIKSIMLETIPVVKEHMDDVCSSQLLAYIKRLVLSLTGQLGSQEFARFFQRQLSSILEDTLQKYHGRQMRECGEDLLVEISDVVFNELAFFRLMQDLDDPNVSSRARQAEWSTQGATNQDENCSEYSADSTYSADEDEENEDGSNAAASKTERLTGMKKKRSSENDQQDRRDATQRGFRITEDDEEELGRERDDEMANQVRVDDGEKDDDEAEHSYQIELAPSETKPFTRIGSDEDDDEGDEEQSMEDPSETAVSRDSMLETDNTTGDRQTPQVVPTLQATTTVADGATSSSAASNATPRPETEGAQADGTEKKDKEKPIKTPHKLNGNAAPATANGVSNSHEDVEGELTVDDLPDRLTVGQASNNSS